MPKHLTISEAQRLLPELSEQLTNEPIVITKEGKPVMITFNIEQFESLIETIEILSDKQFMQEINTGIKQIENNDIISLESLKNKLNL